MKFSKRLHLSLEDSLLEWRDKFIDYKSLKKSLNLIPDYEDGPPLSIQYGCMMSSSGTTCTLARFSRQLREEEAAFFDLLTAERVKVNRFFEEKEEDFVMHMQELKGRLQGFEGTYGHERDVVAMDEEMQVTNGRAFVRIHGEMVLLVNYSALNYTGFAKILKKYDRRTGSLLRIPFMQSLLKEPFFATEIVSALVRECEDILRVLLSSPSSRRTGNSSSLTSPSLSSDNPLQENRNGDGPLMMQIPPRVAGQHDDHIVEEICKNIEAAWGLMKECRRRGSSTYNFFSFPPFGFTQAELDEDGLLTAAAGYGHGRDHKTLFTLPVR